MSGEIGERIEQRLLLLGTASLRVQKPRARHRDGDVQGGGAKELAVHLVERYSGRPLDGDRSGNTVGGEWSLETGGAGRKITGLDPRQVVAGETNIHAGEAEALVHHPEREPGEDVFLTLRSGDAGG